MGDGLAHELFRKTMRISLSIAGSGGDLAFASARLQEQTSAINDLVAATERIAAANSTLSDELSAISERTDAVGRKINRAAGGVVGSVDAARADISELSRTAGEFDMEVTAAAMQMNELGKSLAGIQNIAREIQLLAVNAGVEAARHGASGRGFAVIAEAVKKLADQTRAATELTTRHLGKLTSVVASVQEKGRANLDSARAADGKIAGAAAGVEALTTASEAVAAVAQDLGRCMPSVRTNAEICQVVRDGIMAGAQRVEEASDEIASATKGIQGLVDLSEDLCGTLLEGCENLPISTLADSCREAAARISALFEQAVRSGEIRQEQLFDERYRPIDGTSPQQYLTDFTAFTDRVLPEIQEALLGSDRRIQFCAAADRNGYLPTHNRKFSHPPSDDPVWNAQNARNRRVFDDRTGLASVRSRKPLLLQTYRRDMGGGRHVIMNELAAPIVVNGRHWGGFRLGFRLQGGADV